MSVAFYDTNLTYAPNAAYDCGPNAAGCGRLSAQNILNLPAIGTNGLQSDGRVAFANLRVGFNAAGVSRTNSGPNAAGRPRNYALPDIPFDFPTPT
jgi:hypothetical protein